MQINIIYDLSVANAPAGFKTGVMDAVAYLEKEFTNPITITIAVGYGEVDGSLLGNGDLGASYYPVGEPESYSAVVNALKAENAPGAFALPSTSPLPSNYNLYVSPAEAKALGLPLSVPDGGIDGYVGFSSVPNTFSYGGGSAPPANEYYFIGVVEHEISEIMGRISLLGDPTPDYSVIDLFRYSSPGVRDTTTAGLNSTAYFSIDNGNTILGSWNNQISNGDLADWYPQGPAPGGNDAFNDYSSPGVINVISGSDLTLMSALGWTTAPIASVSAIANFDNVTEAVYIGYFGRAGDPAGDSYWLNQLNSGQISETGMAASFSVQPEATMLYPFLANPSDASQAQMTSFIGSVYEDLFNRGPDPSGLAYWSHQLSANLGNPQGVGDFILAVIFGAQGLDQTTIGNKVVVANFFTQELNSNDIPFTSSANSVAHTAIASVSSVPSTVTAAESTINSWLASQPTSSPVGLEGTSHVSALPHMFGHI